MSYNLHPVSIQWYQVNDMHRRGFAVYIPIKSIALRITMITMLHTVFFYHRFMVDCFKSICLRICTTKPTQNSP